MEEKTLDRGVVTILNGLDLEKHTPLFEKHNVNLELFLSLNEDDIKFIGIDDQQEINLLIKYIKKFRKSEKSLQQKPFEFEEIIKILNNTEEYLHSVNVAGSYVQKQMLENKPLDAIVHEDTAASSAIAILCERIQVENNSMIKDVDQLIKELEEESQKPTSMKKIVFSCTIATALTSILIAGFSLYRKSLLR